MRHERNRKPRPPLDDEALERLALFYAGRYATTRAKLGAYLHGKLAERGWAGQASPPVDALVERFADLGYIDDKAFAMARASSLGRRGYGERRVDQTLRMAGIGAEDSAEARMQAQQGAWESALRFAERKRIGPYADEVPDRVAGGKAMAAMLRAGHPMDVAARLLGLPPGAVPDPDEM